jgi:hypothetical protein
VVSLKRSALALAQPLPLTTIVQQTLRQPDVRAGAADEHCSKNVGMRLELELEFAPALLGCR